MHHYASLPMGKGKIQRYCRDLLNILKGLNFCLECQCFPFPPISSFFLSSLLLILSLFVSPSLYLSVPLLSPSSIRSGWGLRAMTGVTWAVCGSPSRPQTPRTQLQQVRAVADSMCLCAFCGGSPTPTQGTSPFNSGARKGGDLMVWDRQ